VALSPTISKKKKETTKSLKSFEKTTLQQKFKKTAAKPLQNLDRKNKTNPPTGYYPVSNLKKERKKKSGNRIMIFLLLQCPSSLYVIRKKQQNILHYFLDKTDISRHFVLLYDEITTIKVKKR